ncbi:MAG: TonB-dependent receptor [Bacteroidetes bacterium]|jgi:iron complex outermembrane receptor protein/hemoglobin/transferrin/lactoferrin receptor protein|nr:TonB-dependent receptor [Bacteroidota bacterium]
MRILPTLLTSLVLFAFVLAAAPEADGQARAPRGMLEGTVTEMDGTPLAGANVFIPELERGTTTGPEGRYVLRALPTRTLSVRVSFLGYETVVRRVTLQPGQTQQLDVQLTPGTVEAGAIVVTGTPVAQNTLRSTQQVSAIPPEELTVRRTAALGNLVAESVPGAASVQTGSQAGKPVLRGLSGNRIRVLMDGVAQEYYQFGVRHFPNTSLLEAERVEVVRGPSSILYGSDALGGAVNVIPQPLPTNSLGGRVTGQYFTNNQERAIGGSVHGGNDTFAARAGLERRIADNFSTPDAPTFFETGEGGTFGDPKYTGEIPFTNFEQWSAFGQVGAAGEFGSVQLLGDYWQNRHNFILPTGGPDGNASNPPVGLGQNLEHLNLIAKGTFPLRDAVLKPRLSVQRAIRQSAGAGNSLEVVDEAGDDFDWPLDLRKDIYTGRLELLHPTVAGLNGTIGLEATYEDGSTEGRVPLEPDATVFNVGAFIFEEATLDAVPVTLSVGARLDYRTQEADPPAETIQALQISDEERDNSYTTLSGSVGANYLVADGVALVANLGSGFRAPSIFELYANGVHGGVAALQRGDPSLDPERSYSADLGVRIDTDRLHGEVTGYYNAIQNYIYLRNTGENAGADGSGPPIYVSEQTDAWIAGLEAKMHVSVLPFLEVGGEAAFLTSEGEDLEANAQGDRILPLLPANRLAGVVRLEPSGTGVLQAPFAEAKVRHNFDKDAAGRYEPFSQFDAGFGPPFGTASTQAYTVVNLTVGATVPFGGTQPVLSVGVTNLLDEDYRDFLDTYKGYALSPGRSVNLKLTVPFGTQ